MHLVTAKGHIGNKQLFQGIKQNIKFKHIENGQSGPW